jgi:hypothetical protein
MQISQTARSSSWDQMRQIPAIDILKNNDHRSSRRMKECEVTWSWSYEMQISRSARASTQCQMQTRWVCNWKWNPETTFQTFPVEGRKLRTKLTDSLHNSASSTDYCRWISSLIHSVHAGKRLDAGNFDILTQVAKQSLSFQHKGPRCWWF